MAATHTGQVTAPAIRAGVTARARAWLRATGRWLARWSPAAAAKAAGVPVGHAERVLATGCDLAGSLVAATTAAIYYQEAGPGRTWSRLGWEEVGGVAWDERQRVLTLTGAGPGGIWRKELVLPSHTALVELARERVTSTLLASTAVRLGGQVCAWVTARRQPGSSKVMWVVLLNEAADTANPAIRAQAQAAIADLQAQTGIPGAEGAGPVWPAPAERLPTASPAGPAAARTMRSRPDVAGPPRRRRGDAGPGCLAGRRGHGLKTCPAGAPPHVTDRPGEDPGQTMQYRPGPLGGFLATAEPDLTLCNPTINNL